MCYTYQTSLGALTIGLFASMLLSLQASNEKKALSIFFAFVVLMQAFDAVFWKYSKGNINRLATKTAMIFNHLQPIVLALAIMAYVGPLKPFSRRMVQFFAVIILLYTISVWNTLDETGVTPRSAPSLYWKWNHGRGATAVYAVFLATLLVLMVQNLPRCGLVAAIITAVSFLFSFFKYRITDSTGRFWCYFAAYAPIALLVVS
jgi:hypothetical protein